MLPAPRLAQTEVTVTNTTISPIPTGVQLPVLQIAVIGGGPAGLMAAETIAGAGARVAVRLFDAMPSVGRKFLLAGRGGLNLTHSEPLETLVQRYGESSPQLHAMVSGFGPTEVRDWARALGIETFVGSSGLVFPADMKAAPMLRAWLHRLRLARVQFSMRHRWLGWTDVASAAEAGGNGQALLQFSTPTGLATMQADAVVLALGGGSWARLGSDGAWVPLLAGRGIPVAPLQPANCGFDVAITQPVGTVGQGETRREFLRELVGSSPACQTGWTPHFSSRFAGQPFKSVAIRFTDSQGRRFSRRGEFVATATGVEGSLVYAASGLLRDEIAAYGSATFLLDLLPDKSPEQVLVEVRHPRGSRSLSSHLKSRLNLDGIKAAMLYEVLGKDAISDPVRLAAGIKALPVRLGATRPIDEAISSAGGVQFSALDANLQLTQPADMHPPMFCAGEMLDWEAPTGGYLLTACFASGRAAGQGVLQHLQLASDSGAVDG